MEAQKVVSENSCGKRQSNGEFNVPRNSLSMLPCLSYSSVFYTNSIDPLLIIELPEFIPSSARRNIGLTHGVWSWKGQLGHDFSPLIPGAAQCSEVW